MGETAPGRSALWSPTGSKPSLPALVSGVGSRLSVGHHLGYSRSIGVQYHILYCNRSTHRDTKPRCININVGMFVEHVKVSLDLGGIDIITYC